MGRTLDEVVESLPAERRERVDARFQELKAEVEGLRELRQAAGKAQAEIAATLNIKQPSVSKIEKQADMYLSTLKNYIEAIGGQLELIVHLPHNRAMRLNAFGDLRPADSIRPARGRPLKRKPPIARIG